MILLAHLLVGDEQPAFLRFLMPEMTFLTHIHTTYKSWKLFSIKFSNGGIQVES